MKQISFVCNESLTKIVVYISFSGNYIISAFVCNEIFQLHFHLSTYFWVFHMLNHVVTLASYTHGTPRLLFTQYKFNDSALGSVYQVGPFCVSVVFVGI